MAGSEPFEFRYVLTVVCDLPRCLAYEGNLRQPGARSQRSEAARADIALSQVPVAVTSRVMRIARVVGVDQIEPFETDVRVELVERALEGTAAPDVVAGSMKVARV